MQYIKKYRYEIIAAVSGAVVMILELVGARMVAPFFGTSIYVWTAMIGVILGALSLGYWYGGQLADKNPNESTLMKIIALASLCIMMAVFVQEAFLGLAARVIPDVRLGSLVAATILFAPAALLLGVVSPYVAKLKLASLKSAGRSIGRLYAAGTIGSIAGTFLAGYWLIALFGNRSLGYGLVIVLVGLSLFIEGRSWRWQRAALAVVAFGSMVGGSSLSTHVIADVDSAYSRYLVTESDGPQPLRSLVTDPFSIQSTQYVSQPDVLVADYTRGFMIVNKALRPADVLVVGGGVYTFPVAVSSAYPSTDVTAVEIDPKLTDIAQQYFGLRAAPNLAIVNADGRVFLNTASSGAFDTVYMDAFSSLTPPYQLTTLEALQHEKRVLKPHGQVVTNIVAHGEGDPYLSAVVTTYRKVFQNVAVYQVTPTHKLADKQNLLIIATDSDDAAETIQKSLNTAPLDIASTRPLTDDHAPVEQLVNQS